MKIIKKDSSSIFSTVILFVAILFAAACNEDDSGGGVFDEPDNSDNIDEASYILYISSISPRIGMNVESNRDPDLGIVWLGTDENNLPTATLTIIIDSISYVPIHDWNVAHVSSAVLSTVDQVVGTGPEINGKTYHLVSSEELMSSLGVPFVWLTDVEIGGNYISASIGGTTTLSNGESVTSPTWPMKEVTTGELVNLLGSFTAIN